MPAQSADHGRAALPRGDGVGLAVGVVAVGVAFGMVRRASATREVTTALTNRQHELAHVVKAATERHERASLEAHGAYLEAGAALVEARADAKRGTWGPFLEAAGVGERTAQRMMQVAKSGAKPVTVTGFGGVRAYLEWLAVADRVVWADDFAWLNFSGGCYHTAPSTALAAVCEAPGFDDMGRSYAETLSACRAQDAVRERVADDVFSGHADRSALPWERFAPLLDATMDRLREVFPDGAMGRRYQAVDREASLMRRVAGNPDDMRLDYVELSIARADAERALVKSQHIPRRLRYPKDGAVVDRPWPTGQAFGPFDWPT